MEDKSQPIRGYETIERKRNLFAIKQFHALEFISAE